MHVIIGLCNIRSLLPSEQHSELVPMKPANETSDLFAFDYVDES